MRRSRSQGLHDAVADARFVPDEQQVAELLAKQVRIDAQVVGLLFCLRSPHLAKELWLGDDPAGVSDQRAEEGELCGRELQLIAIQECLVAVESNKQWAEDDLRRVVAMAPALDRGKTGKQFAGGKRLGHVVVGSVFE